MNEIKTYYTNDKPLPSEREVLINIALNDEGEWVAELDTNIRKYANRCEKQGWTKTSETLCSADNSWVAATYAAPAKAVSIGKAVRPKRVLSEEQKQAAKERMIAYQKNKKISQE